MESGFDKDSSGVIDVAGRALVEQIAEAVDQLRDVEALPLVQKALEQGIDADLILRDGIMLGMKRFGDKFGKGEYFLPDLLLGSDIANNCIARVTPHLRSAPKKAGRVVIGAVRGDIHSIGKDLVAMQLRLGGFEVSDLGIDVPTMKFIEKASETASDIIALSAFLTSTIPYMGEVVKYLKDVGLRKKFLVIIGGTGTSADYAHRIGADGWGRDAMQAVGLCQQLMISTGQSPKSGGG
ncbi:MAG: cobalamin B12-binding domain-containing protein [Chloroflexi bacterium]|nr:cobalamin B12-binding domain-containing protein [Chloroflexota bacterium]